MKKWCSRRRDPPTLPRVYCRPSLANKPPRTPPHSRVAAGAGQKDGLPVANERMRILGKHSGKLGRLHLRFHGVVAVIEADAENFGRTLQGRPPGRRKTTTRADSDPSHPAEDLPPAHRLGPAAMKESVSGYPSGLRGKTWPSLRKCRANGCITTVGDQAHPSIVHRLAKEWVKNFKTRPTIPPTPKQSWKREGCPRSRV